MASYPNNRDSSAPLCNISHLVTVCIQICCDFSFSTVGFPPIPDLPSGGAPLFIPPKLAKSPSPSSSANRFAGIALLGKMRFPASVPFCKNPFPCFDDCCMRPVQQASKSLSWFRKTTLIRCCQGTGRRRRTKGPEGGIRLGGTKCFIVLSEGIRPTSRPRSGNRRLYNRRLREKIHGTDALLLRCQKPAVCIPGHLRRSRERPRLQPQSPQSVIDLPMPRLQYAPPSPVLRAPPRGVPDSDSGTDRGESCSRIAPFAACRMRERAMFGIPKGPPRPARDA